MKKIYYILFIIPGTVSFLTMRTDVLSSIALFCCVGTLKDNYF